METIIKKLQSTSDRPIELVVCNDGFKISIQAGKYYYCKPKDNSGPWTHFELGFPSHLDDLISHYAEEKHTKNTVFPYVPKALVELLLDKHGGIKEDV